MEIRVGKNTRTATFFEINRGEVFKYEDLIYMKIGSQSDDNAVCLNNGKGVEFYDTEEVIRPAEAYLTIKE